ncbi:Zinc transporter ZIP8 [Lamellibrachia satsuma]|nr:Zinc transporter ZIP8 [Lamellibrachia satsuma]
MAGAVSFVALLALLSVTAAVSELFFAKQLIKVYGNNDKLKVEGLKKLLADVGTGGNATEHTGNGMDCKASWMNNETCLKGMCMSAEQIFQFHSFNATELLNASNVRDISATVLHRASNKNCSSVHKEEEHSNKPSKIQSWGIGLLAITIINLTAVLGFVFKPIMDTPIYKRVMMYMVSLAVGTLSGSSLMILIPEGFKFSEGEYADIYAVRMMTVCGGIYLFFITERCLTLLLEHLERRNAEVDDTVAMPPPSITIHTETRQDRLNVPFQDIPKARNKSESTTELKDKEGHGHSHGSKIKTVGWMIIIGDGIHNFMDGLSLGAAFNENLLGALSVSLSVFSEELPHELGDFAVLLNAGMTTKQAVGFNFLSACTCYIGFIAGQLIGEMTSGTSWVLLLTAGMFLYISLVDMLPEVNAAAEEATRETGQTFSIFLIQNLGLASGWIIILMLALYSGNINLGE